MNIVTGAFSYTGKYLTRRLLAMGESVRTLTGHPDSPNEFGDRIEVRALDFSNLDALAESMKGAKVFYCTYWIRFPHGGMTFENAVDNTRMLIKAARDAGVERIVYISITNADPASKLPYFSGKGRLEKEVAESGLSYSIIRPTVVFGNEGILINNIAWFLRRFPLFPIPGDGEYKLQPVYVEDLAEIMCDEGHMSRDITVDAVGPETFTFNELLELIMRKTGVNSAILHLSPGMARFLSRIMGLFLGDVVLTNDEVVGLMDNLLVSNELPSGNTRLSDWLDANADLVGKDYYSELRRHF